jgi:hypothetical protein
MVVLEPPQATTIEPAKAMSQRVRMAAGQATGGPYGI